MRRRKTGELICVSGLPWMPIIATGILALKAAFRRLYGHIYIISEDDIKLALGISVAAAFAIFLKNMLWFNTQKRIGLLTWMQKFDYETGVLTDRKIRAMYPEISREYLSAEPDGLVLGRKGRDFVRVMMEPGHIFNTIIMGAPGVGKSVLLLTYLIYQFHRKPDRHINPTTIFALDVKPELAYKSVIIRGNKSVHTMNIDDRMSYGWDVYYNLDPDSSDDDVMSELDVIARALIDAGSADKNEFFYQTARNIFIGILLFTFKQGKSFIQGLIYILDTGVSEAMSQILQYVEGKVEYRNVRRLLDPYKGKKGEAFEDVEMTFRQSLSVFVKQDTQFFLDINPRKASPKDLESKISLFFLLRDNKLVEYKCLLRLITMQIMNHCSYRAEDSHMITLIIDEAYRLGVIDWIDFLSTSRSRNVATILAFQSLSQMHSLWGRDRTNSLLELCRVMAVFSCTTPDTANTLSSWAGTYKEIRYSTNDKGGTTKSYEEKKILEPSDIMTLQEQGEVILFIKGRYFRTNVSRARYYMIPELSIISKECLLKNKKEDKHYGPDRIHARIDNRHQKSDAERIRNPHGSDNDNCSKE